MLTRENIETLNAARTILAQLQKDATDRFIHERDGEHDLYADPQWYEKVDGHDLGRLTEAADIAETAIFNVMSTARHFCKVEMTEAELHNRREAVGV